MFKNIFKFLKSKSFLINFSIYILVFAVVCWLITFWLSSYTSHGDYLKVPDFTGIKVADLDQFIIDKKVKYLVIDSLFDTKAPKGTVIKQDPEKNEEVKDGRTIYLYVNSVLPPSIFMPKLIDRSLRQAAAMLTTYGLKLGAIKFIPDQCANCVLEQLYKNKKILPGENIKKGAVINLVVGKGLSDEEVVIPCLFGLTRKEANEKLMEQSLSTGAVTFDEPKDSAIARVYRQLPTCKKDATLKMGESVDLFFTADKNKIPLIPSDTSTTDTKTTNDTYDE